MSTQTNITITRVQAKSGEVDVYADGKFLTLDHDGSTHTKQYTREEAERFISAMTARLAEVTEGQ